MLNVFGMSSERYDALLPCRIPVIAAARKRSVRSSRRSAERTNSSWPSVRGWNASATSAGTGSVAASGPSSEPAAGTREVDAAGSANTRSARASQPADPAFQPSRSAARRVVTGARVARDEGVGEGRREAREVRAHRVERVAPQALLVLPLGRELDRGQLDGQFEGELARGGGGRRTCRHGRSDPPWPTLRTGFGAMGRGV